MKDFKNSLFLLISLLALCCVSCGDDDKDDIVSNVKFVFENMNDVPLLAYPGDEIGFNIKVSSTSNVKKVLTTLNGKDLENGAVDYSGTSKEESYTVAYKVSHDDVGTTLNFVTEAYDSDGNKAKKEQSVYVQSSKAVINIELPTDAPTEVLSNEMLEFVIKINSEEPLRYIKTILNDNELIELTEADFTDTYQFDYNFAYQPNVLDEGKTITFLFEVMDTNGGLSRISYSVMVNRVAELDINEFYDVKIGAQKLDNPVGPFLNTKTGEVYERKGATEKSPDIDITLFYSNNSYGYFFVAPSDNSIAASSIFGGNPDPITGWIKRNETMFKIIDSIESAEFDAITEKAVIENYYNTSSNTEVAKMTTKLSVGSIVGFRTEVGKHGIIIVRSHANGSTSGNVTMDIKVAK